MGRLIGCSLLFLLGICLLGQSRYCFSGLGLVCLRFVELVFCDILFKVGTDNMSSSKEG